MSGNSKPTPYHYSNYRDFVRDSYKFAVSQDSSLNTRKFAKIAGLKSHSHLNLIIRGSRNISDEVAGLLAESFELSSKESVYFGYLVNFNQADSKENKEIFWQKIVRFLGLPPSAGFTEQHFNIFVSWKIPTIFEVMRTSFFTGTVKNLKQILSHVLTDPEIDRGLETLSQLELIKIVGEKIQLTDQNDIASPHSVPFEIFSGFHKSLFALADGALSKYNEEQRFFTGITLALSEKGFSKLIKIAQEVEGEISDLQKQDEKASGVYQINIQAFPIVLPPKGTK